MTLPRLSLHASNHGSAAEAVELARVAERGGLDTVWLSEDLYFRGAMPTAGAVAAATSTIKIAFGVLTPYSQHVSALAMQLASLIDLAGPRVVFGVGAGVEARTKAMDVVYASPLVAVRELVEVLRRLLAGETVTFTGETQRLRDLRLSFDDLPPMPPIYVAAVGPKALEQAGRIADGVVLSLMCTRRHVAQAVERVRAGASSAVRAAVPTLAYMPVAVDDDAAAAVASLKPTIAYYLRRWAPIPSLRRLFTELGPLSDAQLDRLYDALQAGADPATAISDDLVREYSIAGSPAECVAQLRSFRDAGVDEIGFETLGTLDARRRTIAAIGEFQRADRPAEVGRTR